MKSPIIILLLITTLFCFHKQNVESSKKSGNRQPTYYKYYKIKVPYHYKNKYVKWPKKRGRCEVPNWKINGTNHIKEEADKGRVVLLFLMKRTCKVCYRQLDTLNDWAKYYRTIGLPISIIALNHRRQKLPWKVLQQYPLIKFYEEPVGSKIFDKLRANWREIMIFDVCGRQQYHFGYPYSWLGFQWTKAGVMNTLNNHVQLCGKCGTGIKTTNKTQAVTTNRPDTTKLLTTVTSTNSSSNVEESPLINAVNSN